MVTKLVLALLATGTVALAACDRKEPAPVREHAAVDAAPPLETAPAGEQARTDDPREQPIPVHDDGSPLWSANSRNTAEENARRQFERNGADFGAKTEAAYVDLAHAFVADPPEGTLRLTRNNGDRLLYDPKANTFLVATREGAPRTMFKPKQRMAYWEQQKQRESRRGDSDQG